MRGLPCYHLARFLHAGGLDGVPKDGARARALLERACGDEDPAACHHLGSLLLDVRMPGLLGHLLGGALLSTLEVGDRDGAHLHGGRAGRRGWQSAG